MSRYFQNLIGQFVQAKNEERGDDVEDLHARASTKCNQLYAADANFRRVDFAPLVRHLTAKGDPSLLIDSEHFGNYARFVNCVHGTKGKSPNCSFEIVANDHGGNVVWLTAKRNIPPSAKGEELRVYYGPEYWEARLNADKSTHDMLSKDSPWEGVFFTNAIGNSSDCELKAYFSARNRSNPKLGRADGKPLEHPLVEVRRCPKGHACAGQFGLFIKPGIKISKGDTIVHYSGRQRIMYPDNISQSPYLMPM